MAASVELQDTVAEAIGAPPPDTGLAEIDFSDPVAAGEIVAERNACGACHSIDGTKNVGPTWLGLFGSTEAMTGGGSIVVDEAYIAESIRNPSLKIVAGYDNAMTPYDFLSDDEIQRPDRVHQDDSVTPSGGCGLARFNGRPGTQFRFATLLLQCWLFVRFPRNRHPAGP